MSDPRDNLGGAWPPSPLHHNPPDKPRKPQKREFHAESAVCVLLGFLLGCGVMYLIFIWLGYVPNVVIWGRG